MRNSLEGERVSNILKDFQFLHRNVLANKLILKKISSSRFWLSDSIFFSHKRSRTSNQTSFGTSGLSRLVSERGRRRRRRRRRRCQESLKILPPKILRGFQIHRKDFSILWQHQKSEHIVSWGGHWRRKWLSFGAVS